MCRVRKITKWGCQERGGGDLKSQKVNFLKNPLNIDARYSVYYSSVLRGKVKFKHTIFFLRGSAHSQFIPSFRREQHGG